MSPHPPTILISLLNQPIMAQHLGVEVKHFKRRMMDMCLWSFKDEQRVVIYEVETAVQMQEGDHVTAIGAMNDLEVERGLVVGGIEVVRGAKDAHVRGFKVEVGRPEGHVCCEISYA